MTASALRKPRQVKPLLLPWVEPLEFARAIDEKHWVLLYSSTRTSYSGRYSYLACQVADRIEGSDFSPLEQRLSMDMPRFANAWFGYFGYGLKDSLETLPRDQPHNQALPNLCMMRFHTVCEFDHEEKTVRIWSDISAPFAHVPPMGTKSPLPEVSHIASNMSRAQYLEKAAHIIERIRAGDLYQANLTRKFYGEFASAPDAFALFERLCDVSPAPYSAFMQIGETAILSSSPELFLHIDEQGRIKTRPIKGTAPRFADALEDEKSRAALAASEKDRAENLMIVDLMRNDFSKSCGTGSINAEELFEVTSHATIHHLSSTITGTKRPDCKTLDVVKSCFPPGSMTGAPKIRAMELCTELEQQARGIYSGAVGWLGGDGSAELSVVIRTLIINGNRFEFQVGGGIVADSSPEQEFQETIDKSKGLLAALQLSSDKITAL